MAKRTYGRQEHQTLSISDAQSTEFLSDSSVTLGWSWLRTALGEMELISARRLLEVSKLRVHPAVAEFAKDAEAPRILDGALHSGFNPRIATQQGGVDL